MNDHRKSPPVVAPFTPLPAEPQPATAAVHGLSPLPASILPAHEPRAQEALPDRATPAQIDPRAQAEAGIVALLEHIGEDTTRQGLVDTPARVVRAFDEYCAGYKMSAADVLARTFDETGGYNGPVLVRDIEFESRCEHHLAPFVGRAHIAYLPQGRVVGLSKLARLVDVFAKRLQTQERLTAEIAEALQEHVAPDGVAVSLEAEHFCMKVRGVHRQGAFTVTQHFTGAYLSDAQLQNQFLAQIRAK